MSKKLKTIRVKKSFLYLTGLLLIVMLFVGIAMNNYREAHQPKVAKIYTIWGCLDTTISQEEFDNLQKFNQDLFGYSYLRCK